MKIGAVRSQCSDAAAALRVAGYCISGRGRFHSDPHILGEIYACVVGKHAAVRNSNSQFAAPYLAHTDLVAHALDVWLDAAPERDLADADGAALSR
jgi:hypothetical protein